MTEPKPLVTTAFVKDWHAWRWREWPGKLADFHALQPEKNGRPIPITWLMTRYGVHWLTEYKLDDTFYCVTYNAYWNKNTLRQFWWLVSYLTRYSLGELRFELLIRANGNPPSFHRPHGVTSGVVKAIESDYKWCWAWRPMSFVWGFSIARWSFCCGPIEVWRERAR